jgi:hypothetical protein
MAAIHPSRAHVTAISRSFANPIDRQSRRHLNSGLLSGRRVSHMTRCDAQQTNQGGDRCASTQKQDLFRRQILSAAAGLVICTNNVAAAAAQQDACERVATQPDALSRAGKQPLTQRLLGKEQVLPCAYGLM